MPMFSNMSTSSTISFQVETPIEDRSPMVQTPVEGSSPLCLGDNRDLMAEVVAGLVRECDSAFSRPAPRYYTRHRSYSVEEFRPETSNHARSVSYGGEMTNPSMTFEMSALDTRVPGQAISTDTQEFPNDAISSYQTSKRSSLSSRYPSGIADSAISIQNDPKSKRASGRSNLRQTYSPDDDDDVESPVSSTENEQQQTPVQEAPAYPSAAKTALIMVSLYISIFLVALDRTIMGPAIPAITNEFNSISDIGWYGSAYMLTSAGFILLYGRIYTFFPTKPVFLSGIFLFEIGSAICGAATTSFMLIIGRAIAGLGSSGIFTGAILIMLNTVPLHRRPMLQGLFGACFGVASVAGPLLGGAFTGSSLTWRWCFYINLPLGGVTIVVVVLMLKLNEQKPKLKNWKETIKYMDPLGTLLFLPGITCLLLALEWGAADYSWNSPLLIALLVVFAVLFVGFCVWQFFTRKTTATVPARILLQRSVAFGGASQFCVGSTMLTVSIYIPLWFQAIKGTSAMQSGINTIPLVLSVVVGSILSGGLVQRFGYYTPFMILGSILMAVGAGLLTTWNMDIKSSMWIGSEVMLGFGVGCTMQHPNLAVQVVLPQQDIPTGTAILSLCQTLGGAVFAAVGQNLYIDKFTDGLRVIRGINIDRVLHAGATDLTRSVPQGLRHVVLEAYNNALTKGTFFAALIIACLALPAALGMEWRSVKEKQQPPAAQDEEKTNPLVEQRSNGPALARMTTEFNDIDISEQPPLPPPVNPWKKLYRSSGQFSQWMTAKVNPDLRDTASRSGA